MVHQALVYRKSLTEDFPLGFVKTTKPVTIAAGQSMYIHGLARVRHGGFSVHVVAENSFKNSVPGVSLVEAQYATLKSGTNKVELLYQNTTARNITIPAKAIMCQLVIGNLVPKLVAPSDEYEDTGTGTEDQGIEKDVAFVNSVNECVGEYDLDETGVKVPYSADNLNSKVSTHVKQLAVEDDQASEANLPHPLDKLDISATEEWSAELQQKAKQIFLNHSSLFSLDDLDLGRTNLVKHNIILTDPIPFKEKYRRIPPQLYEEVRQHLQEMLRLGAIRESCSPWASAIVLVRKKNGKLRFCIDLRRLNNRTLKDSYSLPKIEQTLEHLSGSQLYSTLDLTSGYWQVEMVEECKPYTAFTVGPLGFYECETMPFGATNAPATFQRLMENCLGELNLTWCIVYLDDIIIFSQTPEEHLERLEAVFKKLSAAGLKLKPSKCNFFKKELTYLGHLISEQGVATDPKKVEAVANWPVPSTVSEVRSFLGFVGYYRRFIKGFSSIAKPLNDLTKGLESQSKRTAKKTSVKWGDKEQQAFDKLKLTCISAPILGYADYRLPFILHTDSSTEGLGAILYQVQVSETRVIAYASRAVSKSEANYAPHKLEFLALKWAVVEKFKDYLYGGNVFDVYTDNNPLTYILTTAKLDACGQRWVAELANYNFNLHYKPGVNNIDADALSRIVWPDVLSEAERDKYTLVGHSVVQAICQGATIPYGHAEALCASAQVIPLQSYQPVQPGMSKDDWVQLQNEDPDLKVIVAGLKAKTLRNRHINSGDSPSLKHYLRVQGQLKLREGVLYRRTFSDNTKHRSFNYQLVLPKAMQSRIMVGCHDKVGHQGRDRTVSLVRERFYWNTLYKDVNSYVAKCPRCLRRKSTGDKAPMQPIYVSQPMELVHMDFLQIEPFKGNVENVLGVTDHFTRYAKAYPSKSQTARATAKLLWDNFIVHYGFPEKFISDQGRNFESQLIQDLCDIAKVQKVRTTPYHPQTNGMCERFNSTLLNMLGTLDPKDKEDWKSHVSTMCHAYNCTPHAATNYSPYYLMFGRHPRLPIDFELGLSREGISKGVSKSRYIQKLQQRLNYAHKRATAITKKESERHKQYYDRRSRGVVLQPKDLVLVKRTAFTGRHKIQDKWEEGEYVILAQPNPTIPVYEVQPVAGGRVRTLHRNLLLPLGGQLEPETNSDEDDGSDVESVIEETPVVVPNDIAVIDGPVEHPSMDSANLGFLEEGDSIVKNESQETDTTEQSQPKVEVNESTQVSNIGSAELDRSSEVNDSQPGVQGEDEPVQDETSDISDLPPDAQVVSTDSQAVDSVDMDVASNPEQSLMETQELLDFIDDNIKDPENASKTDSVLSQLKESMSPSKSSMDEAGVDRTDGPIHDPDESSESIEGSPSPFPVRRSSRTTRGAPPIRYGEVYSHVVCQDPIWV